MAIGKSEVRETEKDERERERRKEEGAISESFFFLRLFAGRRPSSREEKKKGVLFLSLSLSSLFSLRLFLSRESNSEVESHQSMPPRRSTRGTSSSSGAAANAAKTAPAARAIDFSDVDVDDNAAAPAFTPGRLSPSAYLERKEATTRAQLAR